MCGIVAYLGHRQCAPLLLGALRRLEYRGYDSAGVAIQNGTSLSVVRTVGKLKALEQALLQQSPAGTVGIGHTRWATHGRPNEENAHPHVSGPIGLVHNGIIENHAQLRAELESRGTKFSSETDTETVAHLVHEALRAHPKLEDAVRHALLKVRGAYAVAVVSRDEPEKIVVAKDTSPLVVGISGDEVVAASDLPAILDFCRDVVFLEDGELAILESKRLSVRRIRDNAQVDRPARHIEWTAAQAEKEGYKHFMQKEIFEQPRAIEDTLRGRVHPDSALVEAKEIGVPVDVAKAIKRVFFVACGTSAHAAMVGRYWTERFAKVQASVEIASELRYRDPVLEPGDLIVAISQSGETIDTLAAVREAKRKGAYVLAISNVMDSAIPRASDSAIYTHAGPEIGVASTKCFTTQLALLYLLAMHLGQARGHIDSEQSRRLVDALWKVPKQIQETLSLSDTLKRLAKKHMRAKHFLFLGRGTSYPIALEGALKLKEISYIHAEGYAAGEMKHGPIALIDEQMPVVVLCPQDSTYEKTVSNLQEVRAREGQVIAVCTAGDTDVASWSRGGETAVEFVEVPPADEEVLPLLTVVPLQLLAYYIADHKGTDVDQPRNLAKTVTVE